MRKWLVVLLCVSLEGQVSGQSPGASPPIQILSRDAPPYIYQGEDGNLHGVIYQLIRALASRVLLPYEIHLYPWARTYELGLNKPNVLIPTIFHSPERDPLFQWIGDALVMEYHLYGRSDSGIGPLSPLQSGRRLSVAVIREEIGHEYLRQQGFNRLVDVSSGDQAVLMLKEGRVDAILLERNYFLELLGRLKLKETDYRSLFAVTDLGKAISMAFSRKTSAPVVDQYRRAFQDLKRDGTYRRLLGVDPP